MKLFKLTEKEENGRILAGNLDELTSPLTRKEALHLLRRLTFHPTPEQVKDIVGKTASEAFEIIAGSGNEPAPNPSASMQSWLGTLEENPLDGLPNEIRGQIEGRQKAHYSEFINWWLNQMKSTTFPEIEKFTLFLSTIWCIEFTYDTLALIPAPLLYKNNVTLRKNRLASYKTIAGDMSLDGAMIMYQSLFYSTKAVPNENYMRELMELFTMGIGDLETGSANYTEADIREGAKALTGWRTVAYLGQEGAPANRPFETFFVKSQHDTGSKKLFQFGAISPITDDENTEDLVKQKEVAGLIDILFTERGASIARFISDKIIRFFCYSSTSANNKSIVNDLAKYMQDNNFELRKVYKKLFTSKFFFSDEFYGCQIKTPPEFVLGLQKMFSVNLDMMQAGKTRTTMNALEQVLYDPPNVGSWKAYRTWVNTNTFPLRIKFAKEFLALLNDTILTDFIKKFENYNQIDVLLNGLVSYFLPREIATNRFGELRDLLLNGIPQNEWANVVNTGDIRVPQGIRKFIEKIFVTPDFQLC
jgi:uncharacterized protein (DUF1800 family)